MLATELVRPGVALTRPGDSGPHPLLPPRSTRGIPTDVQLRNVNVLDSKHAGVMMLRIGGFTEQAEVTWRGGVLAGQSSNDVCTACTQLSDAGCHKKLSRQSYNKVAPFTPALGIKGSMFAMAFTPGPEKKPWDKMMGYAMVHGKFSVSGVTIADFLGPAGCGGSGAGTFALANHPEAPDVDHPFFFNNMNVVNVASGHGQGMFKIHGPDPMWRNEADCGEAVWKRPDGSTIDLNCAGPAHAYFRDLDGSLLSSMGSGGDASTLTGYFSPGQRSFPFEQGTPVVPGPCTYDSVTKGYSCVANSNAFLLDARLKPTPLPPKGISGDPQLFVLESRDADTESRNFGPVLFNVSGSIDVVTAAMDVVSAQPGAE